MTDDDFYFDARFCNAREFYEAKFPMGGTFVEVHSRSPALATAMNSDPELKTLFIEDCAEKYKRGHGDLSPDSLVDEVSPRHRNVNGYKARNSRRSRLSVEDTLILEEKVRTLKIDQGLKHRDIATALNKEVFLGRDDYNTGYINSFCANKGIRLTRKAQSEVADLEEGIELSDIEVLGLNNSFAHVPIGSREEGGSLIQRIYSRVSKQGIVVPTNVKVTTMVGTYHTSSQESSSQSRWTKFRNASILEFDPKLRDEVEYSYDDNVDNDGNPVEPEGMFVLCAYGIVMPQKPFIVGDRQKNDTYDGWELLFFSKIPKKVADFCIEGGLGGRTEIKSAYDICTPEEGQKVETKNPFEYINQAASSLRRNARDNLRRESVIGNVVSGTVLLENTSEGIISGRYDGVTKGDVADFSGELRKLNLVGSPFMARFGDNPTKDQVADALAEDLLEYGMIAPIQDQTRRIFRAPSSMGYRGSMEMGGIPSGGNSPSRQGSRARK